MMYKRGFLPVMVCFSFCYHVQAQGVIKGFEYGEIINIAQAYRLAPSLSFDLQFNYADSTQQDSIIENIAGSYKIQNGLYWAMIDSTEIVQGNNYNVSVLHYDSIIEISSSQQNTNLLQLPFLDSLFRAQNVDSMNVTQVDDSTRSLQMYFNLASMYSGYTINYDLNTYLMHSISYFVKTPPNSDEDEAPGVSNTSMVSIIFSNYSYQVIDNSSFLESKFIYNQGGQFFVQPAYTGFQLMVNTSN